MTVTMTIEEFDELREAKRTLDKVRSYLYRNVAYTEKADACSLSDAWQYAKELLRHDVAMLVKCAGVYPNYKNVDQPEESEA